MTENRVALIIAAGIIVGGVFVMFDWRMAVGVLLLGAFFFGVSLVRAWFF